MYIFSPCIPFASTNQLLFSTTERLAQRGPLKRYPSSITTEQFSMFHTRRCPPTVPWISPCSLSTPRLVPSNLFPGLTTFWKWNQGYLGNILIKQPRQKYQSRTKKSSSGSCWMGQQRFSPRSTNVVPRNISILS